MVGDDLGKAEAFDVASECKAHGFRHESRCMPIQEDCQLLASWPCDNPCVAFRISGSTPLVRDRKKDEINHLNLLVTIMIV